MVAQAYNIVSPASRAGKRYRPYSVVNAQERTEE